MQVIIVNHKGHIYNIEKEPFETYEEAYQRAWFIINNHDKYRDVKQLISLSFINVYKKKGMQYTIP